MTDLFLCPGCGFELPGTPELTEDCFFCGWVFSGRGESAVPVPKTGRKAAVISITPDGCNHKGGYEKARMIIQDWHTGESYRKMAKRLGVKKKKIASVAAALCNVANGDDKQPGVLVLLGLEPETKPAPVCPECNEVHTVPYCTKEYGEPDKNYPDEIAYLWQRVQDAERFSDAAHAYAEKLLKELEQKKESKPSINRKAAHPSPDDIVSFTVKMTRAQREQINETAKGRGVTTKEMICSEYLEGEKCKAETK